MASIPKLPVEIVNRAPPSESIPEEATESIRCASNKKLNEFDDDGGEFKQRNGHINEHI